MRWQGRRQSSNIEDRRGDAGMGGFGGDGPRIGIGLPGRRSGGLGIGAIAIVLVVGWVLGVNPLTLLGTLEGVDTGGTYDTGQPGQTGAPADEAATPSSLAAPRPERQGGRRPAYPTRSGK